MRVAIEGLSWRNRRGYGRFLREISHALVARHGDRHEFVLLSEEPQPDHPPLPDAIQTELVSFNKPATEGAASGDARPISDLVRASLAMSRLGADLIFFPSPYTFFPVLTRTPVVLCLHDAMTENSPNMFFSSARDRLFWRFKHKMAAWQARKIVTPSEHARRDVARVLRMDRNAIPVIGEGASSAFRPIQDQTVLDAARERYGIPGQAPLLLYVGGISPHKNLDRLVDALSRIDGDWQLALVGEVSGDSYLGSAENLVKRLSQLAIQDRVHFTGFVPEEDLVVLYSSADLVVMPALDEGFGLPAAEAMACGAPIAASKAGALPEVIGDAGLYFDPCNVAEIRDALARLLGDGALRARLGAAGLKRAGTHRWEDAADRLIEVFERTFEPSRPATPIKTELIQ